MKTNTLKIRLAFLPTLAFILFSSCVTYNLSDGDKFRDFTPKKDENTFTTAELEKNAFDLKLFLNPDTNKRVQFLFAEDIHLILDNIEKDLLIVFYNPDCSSPSTKEFKIIKFAESQEIPYLLVSATYSPQRMKETNIKNNLENKNQYIIPSTQK
ncbi:hypothetical protein [Brumimicrobium mesophilum]|uniref:hypothetical protein n=1 Tax=Brumimicrobium mesophilum TaxID=392717 RepID=UPI000D144A16|nr:hypothetical protein [Brumimicrobium mesophilum]